MDSGDNASESDKTCGENSIAVGESIAVDEVEDSKMSVNCCVRPRATSLVQSELAEWLSAAARRLPCRRRLNPHGVSIDTELQHG